MRFSWCESVQGLVPDPDGEFCDYSDYAQLQAGSVALQEVARLAADFGKTQFRGYRAMLVEKAKAALSSSNPISSQEPSREPNYIATEIAKSEADYKTLQEDLDAALEYRQKESEKWNQMQDELEKQLEALQERVAQQERKLKIAEKLLSKFERAVHGNDKLSGCEEFYRGYNAVTSRVASESSAALQEIRRTDQQLQPTQGEQG